MFWQLLTQRVLLYSLQYCQHQLQRYTSNYWKLVNFQVQAQVELAVAESSETIAA